MYGSGSCLLRPREWAGPYFAEPLFREKEILTEMSLLNARKVFSRKMSYFRKKRSHLTNLGVPQNKTSEIKGGAK